MWKGVIKGDNEKVGLESAIYLRGRNSSFNDLIGLENTGGLKI